MKKFQTKDSGRRKVFATGMNRDTNDDKLRYDLVLPLGVKDHMLKRWAGLMTRGAVKYQARNWEKAKTKEEYERFRESAFRHFMQWWDGDTDEDHAAAVFFNISGAEMVHERLNKNTSTS